MIDIENINEETTRVKLELMIRQALRFGRSVEMGLPKQQAEQVLAQFMHDSIYIILSTLEGGGSVREPIDPAVNSKVTAGCGEELNQLLEYIKEYQGYPLVMFLNKLNLGIMEAVDQMYDKIVEELN